MNNTIEKGEKDLNRHFSKEDKEIVNKHTERCSASLMLRKIQIRTIMQYHFTLSSMATIYLSIYIYFLENFEEKQMLIKMDKLES